jgi:sugar lactone lactonase YvrE
MSTVELVLASRDELGEGPVWNADEQALYWVDIMNGIYHRLRPASGEHEIIDVGEKIGVLAFRQSGGLVMATERGFVLFDPVKKTLERIGDPEADKPQTQFNDGAVDRNGRFWAGTLGDPYQNSLYRLDADRSIQCMERGVDVSNGIGWSPDNRVMYYVDSTPAVIYAYDFDLESGAIENRRIFVDRSNQPGVPDGLTVDAAGCIWIAVWDGACIERYDPQGKLMRSVAVPAQFPTSVAFGGPDLDELYITSALCEIPKLERHNFPLAGALFCVKGLAQGIVEPKYSG